MIDNELTIEIVTREDKDYSRSRSRNDTVELVSERIKISDLRNHFKAFMANLQAMIDVEYPDDLPFELKEIQFGAEITADGEFKLLGTGVGIEVSSAVTFVLQRREKEKEVP